MPFFHSGFSIPLRNLLLLAHFAAAAAMASSVEAAEPLTPWPHAASDLQPEAAIRYGTLANGMKFAIMRNAAPSGQVAIRFLVEAGSRDEDDDQRGLAHFLEHMAFRGSTHVSIDEMIPLLERKGLTWGPDVNAYTSFNETVYKLNFPKVDADTVSTGLMLMRETASELKLDPGAFERERGVILSEERVIDTPQSRVDKKILRLRLAGQLAPLRRPIGETTVIRNAPIGRLRDFYRVNYRPERATLVVVGEIDPITVESEIRRRFEDWTGVGDAAPRRDLGRLRSHPGGFDVLKPTSGVGILELAWMRPHDQSVDTRASRRLKRIRDLGLQVLAHRFDLVAHRADNPFAWAKVKVVDLYKSADMLSVSAQIEPSAWRQALAALDQEQRRLVKFGVLAPELDRELQNDRVSLMAAVAGERARTSSSIADRLVASVVDQTVFISPSDALALFDEATKGLTITEVNRAIQQAFAVDGPHIIVQTPIEIPGHESSVAKAFKSLQAVSVSAPVATPVPSWPYTSFGPPGVVNESHAVDDLGITLVSFANGVHLAVKPTKLHEGEVWVRADIGHGRRDFPVAQQAASWAAGAFIPGGLRAIGYDEMWQALSGKDVSIRFSFNDEAFALQGKTRPEDLPLQMQLLAAYTSDPAYRPQAFQHLQNGYKHDLDVADLPAGKIVERYLPRLLHAGDPRWAATEKREIASATPAEFQAQFAPCLANGSVNVSIVGDVTIDDAIRFTAATFGALSARTATEPTDARLSAHFPTPTTKPVVLHQSERRDSAAALLAFPIGDLLSDLPRAYTTKVAGRILLDRLTTEFRRKEGATYTPQGETLLSEVLANYGYSYVFAETTPNKVQHFYDVTEKILDDMRTMDVTQDELARAKDGLVASLDQRRQRNDYWLSQLSAIQANVRYTDFLRSVRSGYENVTAQNVRAVAEAYFRPEKFWKLEVIPGSPAQR